MVREENGLAAEGGADTSHGNSLLLWTWACSSVAATGGWPSDLQVDTLLAWAKGVDNVELVLGELTASLGSDIRVEEWVDVGTDNIDNVAEGAGVLLKDVQWLSGGNWTSVTGLLEDRFGVGNEASKLSWRGKASKQSLVTDNDKGNDLPVWEGGEVVDLWLGGSDTVGLDEDTNNQEKSVLLAAVGNVLEAVAVSLVGRVKANGGKTLVLDVPEIVGDLGGALALSINGVWSVGQSPVVSVVTKGRAAGLWWRCLLLLAHWSWGNWLLDWCWCLLNWRWWRWWSWWRWWRWSRGWLSWCWDIGGEWADVDVVGLCHGNDLLWVSVGAWSVGRWGWVDEDGRLLNNSGRWGNGVGTSGWADEGGLNNGRDDNSLGGANSRNWADNGRRGLNDGGNTAVGVGSRWDSGGGSLADGSLLSHGDGGGWDGVGAWLWEGGDLRSWDWDNWDGNDLHWDLGNLWWSENNCRYVRRVILRLM